MDQANTSRLPRLSRLPVPRSVRPSPSKETLQQQSPARTTALPRLRSAPSREHLSSSAAPRYGHSTGPQGEQSMRKTSSNALYKKPSRQILREPEPVRADSSDDAILEGVSGEEELELPVLSRKHRPSLSERTMETLQRLPSSPVVRKKQDFNTFNSGSPMRPPSQSSRPGSSYQSDCTMGPPSRSFSSRPSSSSGNDTAVPMDFRASTNTFRPPKTSQLLTPVKRPGALKTLNSPSGVRGNMATTKLSSYESSQVKSVTASPVVKSGSKTYSASQLKPRGSVTGLFRKPSMPALDHPIEVDKVVFGTREETPSISSSKSISTHSRTSKASSTTR